MLERQRLHSGGTWGNTEVIRNRVGFSSDPADDAGSAPTKPSSIWPFQCFDWTDHGANSGQTVRYRVSAVRLPAGGALGETALEPVADSDWTEAIEISGAAGHGPHEALGQIPPAQVHEPSPRSYPSRLEPCEYPGHFEVRSVGDKGEIWWRGQALFVSHSLRGERIGLEEVEEGQWSVYLTSVLIARFDEQERRMYG
ncbi:MAG TPA: hypothetical protein VKM72_35205 [Thermoanaerobaculia bacterium]|nr:hypothetical protein [Thermoanaerobaculia bacterium]